MGFIIRRSTAGHDRASASYVVDRSYEIGNSLGGKFRFAKTSVSNAKTFKNKQEAQKVLKSIRRSDPWSVCSFYSVVEC